MSGVRDGVGRSVDTAAATSGPRRGRRFDAHGWRLSTRIAALSLLLLLAVQAAGLVALRQGIVHNAQARLADELGVGERIWGRLLDQRATKLGQGAALLAADYGFRSALASASMATIDSALDNHGARIGATLSALVDTGLTVRAMAQRDGADATLRATLQALAPRLAERGSAVVAVGRRPFQFVMVPMRAPLLVGWVVMGFALDRGPLDDLHAVSGLHAALVDLPGTADGTAADRPGRLLLSSLPPAMRPDALAAASADQVDLADGAYRVRAVGVAADAGHRIVLRLAGSVAAAVAPYRSLQLTLAGLTLLGLLLFGLGSIWTARRVTRPLRSLVAASHRLGSGDHDTPLAHTDRGDEFGELAKAFEQMRTNIGASQREIRQLAYWDRLTGLPNRLQFRDAVQGAIERCQAGSDGTRDGLAVVMLDLDRFKHVNDVLGYASGDRLLQGVALRLQQAVRDGDTVARLGGDEFALLLPHADAELAIAVAARIAALFEQPLSLDDHTVDLSAGLGIACWPGHAAEADALLSRAEVAMYAAKRRTAGAQLYEPALDSASAQTLSLLGELRQAVDNDELRLFLQPKIDLASGRLCGAEALVRWQHPQRGLLQPLQFIPFAEQTGFVRQLTLWMFAQAARHQPALAALGVARVSVNLSTRDLLDPELPERLDAILLRHRALPDAFCLEITESAIMDDPQRAEATLNRLARRGFKLSIDDFGTGYSSLAYLKRLPVNELKIDKSFVMAMAHEAGDAMIVRSTIDLAHNLGLSVVAEGVESAHVQRRLAEGGCDEAQGYHISRPLPVGDFEAWAAGWQALRPLAVAAADRGVLVVH